MDNLITRTKIIPPRRRPDLLSRQRLLDLLHDLLDYKLIIMVAPAGYGKTILLTDFAQHTELPVCWYALDTLDRDPYRFFAYFISAISQRFPDFGRASLVALQSFSNNQGSVEQLVTMVVNELYEHIHEHFVLVIDDYHIIDDNEIIKTFLSQFVQQVDENCHVVLSSRKLLALPNMALMIVRGYVGGLDFEDLAFGRAEVQALVLQNYGKSLPDNEAEALIHATEGWITGLLLSAQSKLRNISGRMRLMRAAGIDLYDYLAQQVLQQQPLRIREFLLRTSVLGEFDAELCTTIFEPDWEPPEGGWNALLAELSQRNLFVLPVGEDGATLRYHHLFQEFLQKKLNEEHPDDERLIIKRLATFYTKQGTWEKAHQLYQRLNDRAAIAELLELAGAALLSEGRAQLLATWLAELTVDYIDARPSLMSLQGEVLSRQGQVQQAVVLFNQAQQALVYNSSPLPLAYNLVRRSIAQRLLGNYQASIEDTDQVIQLIEQTPGQPKELLTVKALALRSKGQSLQLCGQLNESLPFLEQALALFQTVDDTANIAHVSIDIANIYCIRGQNEQALHLFQTVLEMWRKEANISAQATVLNNLGVLSHIQGNYKQALGSLEEAYRLADRSGYTRLVVFSLTSLGDLFVDLEMWSTAQSLYGQALETAQQLNDRFLLIYLELALAQIASSTGNREEVFNKLDHVSKLVLDRKSSYEWGLYQLAIGKYYLLQNKARDAIEALLDAQTCFAEGGQLVEDAQTYFLLAAAWHGANDPKQTAHYLDSALSKTFALGSRHPLITALRVIKDFLRAFDGRDHNVDRLKRLVAEMEAFEQSLPTLSRQLRPQLSPAFPVQVAELPVNLVIRTFGRAEVIAAGKPISNSEWQTQVARDIFFCLLAHPDGLTKEEVGALFWPDASPSELKTRFKNAMYRLRSALNQDVTLHHTEIYRFNRALDYEYDVENFLQKVADGNNALPLATRIAAYSAAVQLYRGPYLPDVNETWVWTEREHLQRVFTEAILTLVQLQFESGDYNAALASCHRVLADDPCLEDAHRLAMRIHAAMGNRAAVARQYAQCQRALLEEIDVPPSPQTEELYSLLMR